MRVFATLLLSVLLLQVAMCGNKGPLVHPDAGAAAARTHAAAAGPTP